MINVSKNENKNLKNLFDKENFKKINSESMNKPILHFYCAWFITA